MADGRKTRGPRWIEQQRSPRYDILVSNPGVANPWYYRPECMALWDGALGRPMTLLHGQAAGNVIEDIALAAGKLRCQAPRLRTRPDVRRRCTGVDTALVRGLPGLDCAG